MQLGSWQLNPMRPTDQSVVIAEGHIQLAGHLGIPVVVMQPGTGNPDHPFCSHPLNRTPEAIDQIVDFFSPLAKLVEDVGTCIALEIHYATALRRFERCAAFIEAIDSPGIKLQMDGANMITFDRYWNTGPFISRGFDLVKDHIATAQAKDVAMRNELHLHIDECPAGEGCMDYTAYLSLLESSLGADGYLIVEHTPPKKVEAAVKHVRTCALEDGVVLK